MSVRLTAADGQYLYRSAALLDYNANYTVMAWVKPATVGTVQSLYYADAGGGGANADSNEINTNATIYDEVTVAAGATNNSSTTTVSAGTWVHYCGVRSGDNLTVYLDGVQVATVNRAIAGRDAIARNRFGVYNNTDDYGNYSLAYIRAWSAALNAIEIAAEMASAAAVRSANIYSDTSALNTTDMGDDSAGNHPWSINGTLTDDASNPTLGTSAAVTGPFPVFRPDLL
jgi:hypothetical protein